MDKLRSKFPVLRQYIYANTASLGLFSEDLLDWRQEHDLDFLLGGSTMRSKSLEIIQRTRESVGSMFHCKSDSVALISNFSLGINMVLSSLEKNRKILLLENDYPSVSWPFDSREFNILKIPVSTVLEKDIEEVVEKEKIQVLALSIVQWVNGVKIDLDFLKKLKAQNPNLLIIADGTQYCGTEDFNFEESGIDILAASAYKWLLSGYGNGFMLFKESVKDKFNIPIIGFSAAGADETQKNNIPFVKKFEPGHLSCLVFGSLNFSVEFMMKIGMDKIEKRIKEISAYAKEEFIKLDVLEDLVVNRKIHSSIFCINGNDKLFQHLTDNGVVCSQRGEGIRFSFHFYNTEKDVQEIVKIVKAAK
ncbi:aminotransferase class V-fold PLP-dependent enzyme [uncultured Maribacter sp.]|uniref:aminotransferase class V-fold PLP-dependent enzyme n=1 Tax=uncultured Maribacter sp. TaxID=431308 RepID=UPI00261E5988|nr:aminotransferase class V-fold PLP-dependent enzyme [uncultured Maribacter sp.]